MFVLPTETCEKYIFCIIYERTVRISRLRGVRKFLVAKKLTYFSNYFFFVQEGSKVN